MHVKDQETQYVVGLSGGLKGAFLRPALLMTCSSKYNESYKDNRS